MTECDVVVVGGGAMGSAAAWWLAKRGVEVVLLEQFEAGHRRGSSHGSTRIFRLAYPDRLHLDLALQALPLWRQLEETSGTELLQVTGGIDFGPQPSVRVVADTLGRGGVRHRLLPPEEARELWPGFGFEGSVLYQPDSGRILADTTVRTLQSEAGRLGVDLHFCEPVRTVVPRGDRSVSVITELDEYRASVGVVTAGAWAGPLLTGIVDLPALRVTREQVFHFPSRLPPAAWPSFIFHGHRYVYGLHGPDGEGVKVAEHHAGAETTADGRSFDIDPVGRRRVIEHVRRWMPGLDPHPSHSTTCLYTNAPDEHFIIERHGPVVVGSACSGHGFKFVPLVGRMLADLAT